MFGAVNEIVEENEAQGLIGQFLDSEGQFEIG